MTLVRPRAWRIVPALLSLGALLSASDRGLSVLDPVARGRALLDPMWTSTGDLMGARYDHTATVLLSGKVLVTGGFVNPLSPGLSSAELYDPIAGVWTPTGGLSTGRALHSATLLASGKVLVVGGVSTLLPPSPLTSGELYDPDTGLWTPAGNLAAARAFHTATSLASGQVLVVGGIDFQSSLSSAELYDPATSSWGPTGGLAAARGGHTATPLPSGKVLVAGGYDPATPPPSVLSSCELYDPGAGSWSATGGLATARYDQMAAPILQSGKVLVAAGYSGVVELSSAELYDPDAGLWGPTSDLTTPRRGHSVTVLQSGLVLVAGGIPADHGPAVSSAELYDPVMGTWTMTSSMMAARFVHRAILLMSGQVLVVGGRDKDAFDGVALSSSELYF